MFGLYIKCGVLLDGSRNKDVLRFFVLDESENFLLELVSHRAELLVAFGEQIAGTIGDVCHRVCHAVPAIRDAFHEAFGAVCGRDAREVGDFVQKAAVDFVSDSRKDGGGVVCDRAAKRFAIKEVQVRLGAASAHDADNV